MPAWLLFVLIEIVFAASATWVSRRLLDGRIGVARSTVTALVVFLVALPVALRVLDDADVYRDGRIVVDGPIAVVFVLLTIGWIYVAVVIAISIVEFLWPSRGVVNPITTVREALQRRDRARRYAQILAIASRHGLGVYRGRRRAGDERGEIPSTALVAAMNDAGVTFVKLGQVLSTREDILPPDLVRAFSTLQMDSTPIPWDQARAAIQAELPRPMDEVFARIDETPLAAASVAQVHSATLGSGEEVVVKVQRPQARAQVTTDLDILARLSSDAERHLDWAREYGLSSLSDAFARALREELDYRIEAENTEMLRRVAAESEVRRLRVPQVFAEFSTERMLVQERAQGTPFSRLAPGAVDPDTARAICDDLTDAVIEQVLVRGVFHADLHPGNLLLADDGTVTLIDFGSVGVVPRSIRRLLLPLLVAVSSDDDATATDAILTLCEPATDDTHEQRALQADLGVVITRLHNSPGENVFRALVDVLRSHRLAIPPSLLLVFRTLGSLEGTLRRLSPGYDMTGRGISRAGHFATAMVSPGGLLATVQARLALAAEQLATLPRRLQTIGRKLEDGTFEVKLAALSGDAERGWIDGMVGRIVTAIVAVALVVTGILLLTATDGPLLTPDVPAFAFLGSLAGLGGMLLVVRVLRASLRDRG